MRMSEEVWKGGLVSFGRWYSKHNDFQFKTPGPHFKTLQLFFHSLNIRSLQKGIWSNLVVKIRKSKLKQHAHITISLFFHEFRKITCWKISKVWGQNTNILHSKRHMWITISRSVLIWKLKTFQILFKAFSIKTCWKMISKLVPYKN